MANPTTYSYDIFISYAHVDNMPGGKRGWVYRFQNELKARLDRKLGRIGLARIWWDSRLDGSHVFNDVIQEAVGGAALFIALTSEGYLKSDYCGDELKMFCKKIEDEAAGAIVTNRARVLNVLLDNITHERWPARYGGSNGYRFYDEERGTPLEVKRKDFDVEINKMVNVIHEMLTAIGDAQKKPEKLELGREGQETDEGQKTEEGQEEEQEKKDEEEQFTVFVADTSTTLKTVRSRVYAELTKDKRVRITDLIPPPRKRAEHEEKALEKIKNADLCVHLLDSTPGREIDDEPSKSYLEVEAGLSLLRAKSQFVWASTELTPAKIEEIEDEPHRKLLQLPEDGPRREGGDYKFGRDRQNTISNNILEHIEQIKKRRLTQQTARSAPRTALIDLHLRDWEHGIELNRFLLDKRILTSVNKEADSPKQNLRVFEDQLRQADLLIIVFGSVTQEWVRERLGEALKIAAVAQDCPLRACGVYLAPPHKDQAEVSFNRGFLPIEVLDNTKSFNPQTLDTLLSKLQAGA